MKTYLKVFLLCVVLLAVENGFGQTAQVISSIASGCSPLVVQFDGTKSTGTNLNYSWDFGNGNTAYGKDKGLAAASYITPGVYSVKLTVSDATGSNTIVKQNYVIVFSKPVLDFNTPGPLTACAPHALRFSNAPGSAANIRNYTWDFGDGTSSSAANPDHTFSRPGNYTVSLIATDSNGCTNSLSKPNLVHIKDVPKADFSEEKFAFCKLPARIVMQDKSINATGESLNYQWDFGDGGSSSQPNPEHGYQKAGLFDVKLSVSNSLPGCASTKTVQSLVSIQNYEAGFNVTTQGCNPLRATFKNTSTVQSFPIRFIWAFGDGTSSNEAAPVHDYTKAGNYTITLEMLSPDTACKVPLVVKQNTITVPETGTIDFIATNTTSCALPFNTAFKDLSQGGISWEWDFGDGQKSTVQNPRHTYATNGNYTVLLAITEASGCIKTLKKENYIQLGGPAADFTISAYSGCIPFNTQFSSTTQSADPVLTYLWNFGDGAISNNTAPNHTYPNPGTYEAFLTVVTASGCTSTSSKKSVLTGAKPHAEFDTSAFPLVSCKPLKFTFRNLSRSYDSLWLQPEVTRLEGKANSTTLLPGDVDLTYTYVKNPEVFSPHLLAFNHGCLDTFFVPNAVTILPPKAAIQYTVPSCNPGAVIFKDASAGATSVRWNFGTGHPDDTSTLRSPAFTYRQPGTYKVSITAYYDKAPYHCEDTASVYLYVPTFGAPQVNFAADKTDGCIPFTSAFTPTITYPDSRTQPVSARWYIGTTLASSDGLPKIVFDKAGSYDVSLVVTDSRGCVDSIGKRNYIRAAGPRAQFTDLVPGCFPYTATLSDRSISPFQITKRIWMVDSLELPDGDTLVKYFYNNPDYSLKKYPSGVAVTLKVSDQYGCSDSITKKALLTKPSISYTKTVVPSCGGDTIELKSTMTDTSGRSPFSYEWHINNITVSTSQVKAFFPTGSNESYLKAVDASGCSDSVKLFSTIGSAASIAAFTANPRVVTCWPGQVMFYDSSKVGRYGVKQWSWDFGDTATSTLQNPSHIYTASGLYDIRLIITDSIGCQDTLLKQDYINIKGPSGNFTLDTTYGYAPLGIQFTSNTINATKFVWDYGDGNLGENKESTHTYLKAGTYIPKLIIEDDLGCKSVYERDTIIVIPCAPVSQKIDTSICYGTSITLSAGYPQANHLWNVLNKGANLKTDTSGVYIAKIIIPGMPCYAFDTFSVNVIDLRHDIGNDTTVCFGQAVPVDTKLSGSQNEFYWSNGIQDSAQIIKASGKYLVTVQDTGKYCYARDSIKITVLPKVIADAGPDKNICIGDSMILTGTGGTISRWLHSNINPAQIFVPAKTETFTLLTTDSLKCAEAKDDITVFVHGPPQISVPKDTIFCSDGGPFLLDAGAGLEYEWDGGKGRSRYFESSHGGIFNMRLFNEWGCFAADSMLVQDKCPPKLFIADAFSPNGDGSNDLLHVYGAHLHDFEMTIFNRWGEIVFKSADAQVVWDGMYRGAALPPGIYAYTVTYTGETDNNGGKPERANGSITLVR